MRQPTSAALADRTATSLYSKQQPDRDFRLAFCQHQIGSYPVASLTNRKPKRSSPCTFQTQMDCEHAQFRPQQETMEKFSTNDLVAHPETQNNRTNQSVSRIASPGYRAPTCKLILTNQKPQMQSRRRVRFYDLGSCAPR